MTPGEKLLIALGLVVFVASSAYWLASIALAVEWWLR